jgi:trehalose 6-phosphate phosphatase
MMAATRSEATGVSLTPPIPARDWAYFFDLDGTLVDIADSPSGIVADDQLRQLLIALHHSAAGALAIITGRSIVDVDALFPALRFAAAGQHGLERRDAAGRHSSHSTVSVGLERARRRLLEQVERHPGLLLEDKGLSLALHYRQAPRLAGFAHQLVHRLQADIGDEYTVQAGKRVVELKPAGKDKGAAILDFMHEPPFAGRVPVFIGDDSTDEYGFIMVNHMGGHSVKVGPGRTIARWRLNDVPSVLGWLRAGTPRPVRVVGPK